jgi:hypothetical protein
LALLSFAMLIVSLDQYIVVVALPDIATFAITGGIVVTVLLALNLRAGPDIRGTWP